MTSISTEEFDRRFDEGEGLEECLDMEHPVVQRAKVPSHILITLPEWLVLALDAEAERRGIARKALINTVLVEWVDEQQERAAQRGASE